MKKALIALAFSCPSLWLTQSTLAQDNVTRTIGSVAVESGSRQQDKLTGPVRRVRVETALILPKNGNWVEGTRELLGITTYDPAGRKIDSAVYPVERNTLSGKEQYTYDQKGNVVEMILRSADGSMLSKESYKYEFDQLGNWTKMSSSVAVFENGKVIFEPTGVTYRTISYYYSQAVEKLGVPSPRTRSGSAPIALARTPRNSNTVSPESSQPTKSSPQPGIATQVPPETANAHPKTELVTAPASVIPARNTTAAPEVTVAASTEIRATPENPPATNVVQYVAEEDLRQAALELPKAEYSDAALQAQASGQVKVQILVDESGKVTTAQATSGHPLLSALAEAAARNARFSMARVSPGATRVYGVISYDFVLPKPAIEVPVTSTTSANLQPKQEAKPKMRAIAETSTLIDVKPKAPVDRSEAAGASYSQGVTFQSVGRYSEAADAFNQAIRVNPNDARAYARLGMAYSALNKHNDAIVVYKMALQIDESVLGAPAYYMWGHSYLALSKNSDALSAFKQALKITNAEGIEVEQPQRYPSLEQLHYSMGISYLNSRRFDDSIKELKQVVKLNPKHAEAHYTLVVAYLSNGNRRDADGHYRTLSLLNSALAQKLTSAIGGLTSPPGCLNIACRR